MTKGIILAAGRGSRMKDLTTAKPKALLTFKGLPLIDHQINAFKKSGIDDIAIVTGYKRNLFEKYNLRKFHNRNWEKTNMVVSLMCANEWLSKFQCIVSYSDIFYGKQAISILKNNNHTLSLTYDPNWLEIWTKRFNRPLDDAESFQIDLKTKDLLEIGQKEKKISKIMGQYMGLVKFTPKAWHESNEIFKNLNDDELNKMFLTDLLQKIINNDIVKIKGKNILINGVNLIQKMT